MTDDPTSITDQHDVGNERGEKLLSRAKDDARSISGEEMREIIAFVQTDTSDTQLLGAEALQHLYTRPELFAPHLSDILSNPNRYPADVDGIPSLQSMMASEEIRASIYIADSLARVSQSRPTLFESHVDRLVEIAFEDESTPAHYLFVLGYVFPHARDEIARDQLVERLCSYLDKGRGHGYPSWAADTLRVIGDSSALPALREHYPENPIDDATKEAFDAAIERLER
jgi:hypothetical protein